MANSVDDKVFHFILNHSMDIAGAGVFIYIIAMILIIRGWVDPTGRFVRAVRFLTWCMLLVPVCTRIFFSQNVVLGLAIMLSSLGLAITFKSKMSN